MTVTAIIVNYKVPQFLLQCIDSLLKSIDVLESYKSEYSAEIVVVDNNSQDGSQQLISRYFPTVKYIALSENLGFAKANNIAIRESNADYILLVNPDVFVGANTLLDMVKFAESHTDVGAIGPRIINIEGSFLPESKRNYPTMWTAFTKLTRLSKIFKGSNLFDRYYNWNLDEHSVGKTDILVGAFMMLNKKALGDIALLDEDFFMYGEDIDLSVRITEFGLSNYYLPTTIVHYKGESTNKDSLKYISSFYGAMRIFYRKHSKNRFMYGLVYSSVAVIQRILRMIPRAINTETIVKQSKTLSTAQMSYDEIINYVEQHGADNHIIISHPQYNIFVYGMARG